MAPGRYPLIVWDLEALRGQMPLLAGRLARWGQQRHQTIAVLRDLLEKLQGVSTCADVARGVGDATVLLGALATIVGAILELIQSKNAKIWLEAGEGLKSIGEMAVPGVNLLELGISEVFLKQVKTALQRDQELSRPLNQWILLTQNLDRRVRETFGVSLTSSDLLRVLSSIGNSLDSLCSGGGIPELARVAKQVMATLDEAPGLTSICRNGLSLGAAVAGLDRLDLLDRGLAMAWEDGSSRRVGLEAVRAASQLISIMQDVRSVREGRRSDYCKKVEEVLDILKAELQEVTRLERDWHD